MTNHGLASTSTRYWAQAFERTTPETKAVFAPVVGGRVDVMASVLRVAQQRRDLCMRKRWSFRNAKGDTIILRDVMERLIVWIDRFKAVGDIAVGADQGLMSLPWAAVRFLLECASSDVKAFGAVAESLEVIGRIVATYREYEGLYLDGVVTMTAEVEAALIRLYQEILECLGYALQYFGESTIARMAKSTFRMGDQLMPKIREREEELRKLAGLLDTKTLRNVEAMTMRLAESANTFEERVQEERYDQILTWLSKSDFLGHHWDIASRRLPDTGQWLLDHSDYKIWSESSSSSIILIHGVAGSGKSILASKVVDTILAGRSAHANPAPFAYFYCSSSVAEPERAQPENIMRCIVRQLAMPPSSLLTVRETVLSEYDRSQAKARLDGFEHSHAAKLKLPDCQRLILDITYVDPVTIIIDAIDEIDEQQRYDVIELLRQVVSQSANVVKVFITSRYDNHILSLLDTERKIPIRGNDNRQDLEAFVSHQLDSVVQQKRLLHGLVSPDTKNQVHYALLQGAGEMFLWAQLQLEQFCHMKHEADILSAVKERRVVTLGALYKDTFDSILSQGGKAQDLAVQIFSTLLFVKEPLSPEAFCYAISRRNINRNATVTMGEAMLVCFNLIVQTSQSVRFVHQSVREYICTLQLFQEHLATSLLAEACLLTCMQGPPEAEPSADETHGFYRYAAMYWGDHALRTIETYKDDAVSHLVLGFVFEEDGSGEIAFSFMAWLDYVKELITHIPWEHAKYVDLDAVSSSNETPLFTACIFGLTRLLQHLGVHAAGFDWNQRNDRGHTGLYLACRKGFTTTIKFLLDHGAAVDISCGTLGNALNAACFSHEREAVELLLSHGHDLFGATIYLDALAIAYTKHDLDVAMLLLDHCIACFKDDDLSQALLGASQAGLIAVVERLRQLPHYLASNVRTEQRYNKAIRGGQIKMIRYTMQKLSHLAKDLPHDGVATAALYGQAETVSLLLDLGLDVESEGSLGSPLRTACLIERRDIVELLIRRGAEIDKKSSMGTALQTAAMRGSNAVIAQLLDEGADVDLEGRPYGTALGAAVHNGHKSAAELLLAAGASLERMPQNSLEGAFRGAHEEMLAFLRKIGFQFHDPPLARRRGPYSILETATPKSNRLAIRYDTSPMGVKHAIPDDHRADIHRFTALMNVEKAVREPEQHKQRPLPINRVGYVRRNSKRDGFSYFQSQQYQAGPSAVLFEEALLEAAAQGQINAVRSLLRRYDFISDVLGEALDEAATNGHRELADVISKHAEVTGDVSEWQIILFTSGILGFVNQAISYTPRPPAGTQTAAETADERPATLPKFPASACAKALYRACELGSLAVFKLLVHHDYVPEDADVLDKAIEISAEYGSDEIVSLLLSRRQGDIVEDVAERLLTCAAYGGHHGIMILILARIGELPNFQASLARPLVAAVTMGHAEAVTFLIQQGADVDLWVKDCFDTHWNNLATFRPFEPNLRQSTRGTSGASPLWACLDQLDCKHVDDKASKYEAILSILLDSGAKLSSSAMCTAARKCSASVMQILVRAGGDVNSLMWPTDVDLKELGMENERPLDIAMGRHEDAAPIVEVLLSEKAFMETSKTGGVHPCLDAVLSSFVGSRRGMRNLDPHMSLTRIFEEGLGAVVFNLLKAFPEEKTIDPRYAHILQMAAFLGHLPFVELLIERGVLVNSVVDYYGTALQAASCCGHADTVKALLGAGAQVNTISGACKTALRAALKGGHVGIVQLLLENAASVDIVLDKKEMSDLHMAIDGNNLRSVDLLLAEGVDPNSGHHPYRPSALQAAYDNRNVKIMKRLLCAGAKLDTPGTRSLLYWACQAGHTDMAKLLVEHGADVNAETEFAGYGPRQSEFVTPLMAAARWGGSKCVSLLLESGASVTTPALVAATESGRSQPLQMLLDHLDSHGEIPERASLVTCLRKLDGTNRSSGLVRGGLPSIGVQAQKLALLTEYEVPQEEVFLAVCRLEIETMLRSILAQGIDLAEDELGSRAVRIVAHKFNEKLLSLLLQHGAAAECSAPEPNHVPVVQSVLHENLRNDLYSMKWNAKSIPHVQPHTLVSLEKVITLLLDNGATVNGSPGGMGTPLQLAALIGSKELVRRMLDAQADINVPGPVNAPAPGGKMFANALQAAEKGGHLEVVEMLKSAGALDATDRDASSSPVDEYASEEEL